jgi:hypothetical protein
MAVMHEFVNNVGYEVALAPVVVADNTAQVGAIIDMLNVQHVTFVALTGTIVDADATFAWTIHHGDVANLSDATVAGSDVLVGTIAGAAFDFASDSVTRKIGYTPGKGAGKRYVRATITPTGNVGNAPMAIVAVKMAKTGPVA